MCNDKRLKKLINCHSSLQCLFVCMYMCLVYVCYVCCFIFVDYYFFSGAEQLYEEAMKKGSVQMSIIKCLDLGIAGVGKTHLKRLLLSEKTDKPNFRVSTGLADNPVQAFVGSVESIVAGVDENDTGRWEVMDDEKLLEVLVKGCQLEPALPTIPIETLVTPHSAHHEPYEAPERAAFKPDDNPSSPFINPSQRLSKRAKLHANDSVDSLVIDFFRKIKDSKMKNVKLTLVQFIDSGGQPQFLELLPAFIQNVSMILFVVNLSEHLDHCPYIYFYKEGQPVGKPYKSPSSHKQVLEQCIRAASARDVHPLVFVVGTHRDMVDEHSAAEMREDRNKMVREVLNSEYLINCDGKKIIWEVNGKTPNSDDQKVANKLRKAIVAKCSRDSTSDIPIKWFVLQMKIQMSARLTQGILGFRQCLKLAESLGMDEQDLEASLLHLVKYNLFLWYHKIPALRDVVFSDPQAILKIVTDLVLCKYELAGGDVPQSSLSSEGVEDVWCTRFRDHAVVSHEFLCHNRFRCHFVDDVFTAEHFAKLKCHLFIMVSSEKVGEYLMPALLDVYSGVTTSTLVEPLIVCVGNKRAPYGIFICLVAFLQEKDCSLVEKQNLPVCLYRNRVSFKLRKYPAKFTIVDSMAYIEVHLDEGNSDEVCLTIRNLIHEGIKKCADILHYSGWKDLKDGFICSNGSCRQAAIPYEKDTSKAGCDHCSKNMTLTKRHTVWLPKEDAHGMYSI